jgi:hypothetical protein
MTVLAPSGIGAPVMMGAAVPRTRAVAAWPAAIGATTRKAPEPRSSVCTAYPSIWELSQGGNARGASRSWASVRPNAWTSSNGSLPASRSAGANKSSMASRCPRTLRRNGGLMPSILGRNRQRRVPEAWECQAPTGSGTMGTAANCHALYFQACSAVPPTRGLELRFRQESDFSLARCLRTFPHEFVRQRPVDVAFGGRWDPIAVIGDPSSCVVAPFAGHRTDHCPGHWACAPAFTLVNIFIQSTADGRRPSTAVAKAARASKGTAGKKSRRAVLDLALRRLIASKQKGARIDGVPGMTHPFVNLRDAY